jgi:hypothetical protein
MKTVYVEKKPINHRDYVKRSAEESDSNNLIEGDTVLVDKDTKDIVVIYKVLGQSEEHKQVFQALRDIKYYESKRTSGLMSRSRIFGYSPRNKIRIGAETCKVASLAKEDPTTHAKICRYAKVINDIYSENKPDLYARHKEMTERVLNDYVIPETLFTSGIVNYNNPLKYHFDAGNFSKVCSAMIAFKQNTGGGHLVLPEYDVKLAIEDTSITLFDGQNALHGVTPIQKFGDDSYRFTMVFYSLVQMWKCLPLDEEIAEARASRWQSELKKYERKK